MQHSAVTVWQTAEARQFAAVLTAIDDARTMQHFLRDVLTEKEIIEISARLKAAQLLRQGRKYTDVVTATRLSSRTVARISDWLQHGCGGYAAALQLVDTQRRSHTPPDRT